MASRSRRRRRRVHWFPTIGTTNGGITGNNLSGRAFALNVNTTGLITTAITSLTFDQPKEESTTGLSLDNASLADMIGSGYLLRRVVGKMFAWYAPPVGQDIIPAFCLFGAGLFVARADAANPQSPIGFAGTGTINDNQLYSPLSADVGDREPWLWRRTWLFHSKNEGVNAFDSTPTSTMEYGSVADGPHIDQKTLRKVDNDNRLWLAVSTAGIEELGEASGTCFGYFDYRLLGTLLPNLRQRGSF